MVSFVEGLANAFKALNCSVLANSDYVFGSIYRATGQLNPLPNLAVSALRRLRGCDPAADPLPPPPPFEGGQCEGYYRVLFTASLANGSGSFPINYNQGHWGPIRGFRTQVSGTRLLGFITARSSPGGDTCNPSIGPGELMERQVFDVNNRSGYDAGQFQIVEACGDDNCGNPPTLTPPTNITTNIDVTYNIDDGTEVTVNIPITINPFFQDFSGTFNFPFEFNLGGVDLTGSFTLSPDLSVNINSPRAPEATKDPTETLPPGDPADDVPPVAVEDKVIGVVAIATIVGEQQITTIATQGMPPILAPRAGSIKFAYSVGISTFWSSDIDLKTGRTFIPCPFSQGADAVVVSPAPGIAVQWVPITGPPLATARDVLSTREL